MDREAGVAALTPRERQIARAYAAGQTYRDIATGLHIAPSTVRAHLAAVYRKLVVSSKIELLRALGPLPIDAQRPSGRGPGVAVVVLPFEDRRGGGGTAGSDDGSTAFLAEALTDAISAALSRFRSLVVLSRRTASGGSRPGADLVAIGRELGASYAVGGALNRAGGRLRVATELIEMTSGAQVWLQPVDRDSTGAFELLDGLAPGIVSAIAAEVEAHEIERARRTSDNEATAWQWCCRGLHDFPSHDPARLASARAAFERAIAIDPGLACAHAHLARTHFYEVIAAAAADPQASIARGLAEARTALALDDRDESAYLALGYCLTLAGQNADALAALDYGLQLNPLNCNLYNARALARLFSADGDLQQVIADAHQTLSLSPNDPMRWTAQVTIGWTLLAGGDADRHDEALAMLRKAGTVANADWHVHIGIAIGCLALGDTAGAAASVAEARRRRDALNSRLIAATLAPLLGRAPRLAGWVARLVEVGLPAG